MGTITDNAAEIFRDYETVGVPASGEHEPEKPLIRELFADIESAIGTAALGSVDVAYATRAQLDADLAHVAGSTGLVYADATDANNDLYVKVGASGAGSWTLTSVLHDVIEAMATPYVDEARQWASEEEDVVVDDGLFSARHYSLQSAESAAAATATMAELDPLIEMSPAGINLDVDFSGAANGTNADTVGTPPMTSQGVMFTVQSGLAESPVGTALATPAYLLHEPNDPEAVCRVAVNTAGMSDTNSARFGALAQFEDVDNFCTVFTFDRTTSKITFKRSSAGTLSFVSDVASGLPTGLTEWTFETRYLGNNQYGCIVEAPDGERSAEYVVSGHLTNSSKPFLPAYGVYAGAVGAKVSRVIVDTDRVDVLERIDDLEEDQPFFNVPTKFDRSAARLNLEGGRAFSERFDRSEAILIDNFTADYNTAFPGTYEPDYVSPDYPVGDYTVLGTATWAIRDNAVALKTAGSGTAYGDLDVVGITADLPTGWYHRMRGVEVRMKIWVPAGLTSVSVILRYDEGRVEGDGPGALFIQWNRSTLQVFMKPDDAAGESANAEFTFFTENFGATDPGNREIEFVIRAYNSTGRGDVHDMLIAEVDGRRAAYFFFQPLEIDPKRSMLRDITAVGFAINPLDLSSLDVRVREFTVGPVPIAGSNKYRSLPPEPAPVVPELTKVGLVFDAANTDPVANGGTNRMLGPSILPMLDFADALGIVPIDNYYMYYSSDHASGEGGIWLTTAPDPEGPWTNYEGDAGNNRVYVDLVAGTQTEHPQVVYDEDQNRLIMIYHNSDVLPALQQSIVATSGDGLTWTRQGIAADTSTSLRQSLVNHDGYASFCAKDPLGIVPGWIGWWRIAGGLGIGGGPSTLYSHGRSKDGISWSYDLLPIAMPSIERPVHDQEIIHFGGMGAVPFAYRQQRLLPISPLKASGQGAGAGYLAIVRLGDDMRNMSAEEHIITPDLPTEVAGMVYVASVFVRGNTLYLYYIHTLRYLHLITADLSLPPAGQTRTLD